MSLKLFLCSLVVLVPFAAHGQYTVNKVVFQHPGPYTDAELLTTSGLHAGQPVTRDSLASAAQHLLDTGLFEDAQITTAGAGRALTIILDLKPIPLDKLLPASFENFVWFTPDELSAGIRQRVPLYRNVASDAGNLPDAIQTALQQMLAEKGISASLSHLIVEPTTRHPRLVVNFTVESPTVSIGSMTLTGVPPELSDQTMKALAGMRNKPYNEGLSGLTMEDVALGPARNAGYIDAHLEAIQRSAVQISGGIAVNYSATLVTGDRYQISAVRWQPTTIYSAADFARDNKLHAGDPASLSGLANTESAIAKAYRSQGFMDVYLLASPVIDTAAHTVAYTLEAVQGQPYRLHAVTATGLSAAAQKVFDADWQMKPGDPYSDLAVNAFLTKHIAQPDFRPYSASFRAVGDPETHLVDLTVTFVSDGGSSN